MLNSFKNQAKRDIKTVFHNENEHADRLIVEYNNKKYKIPVIVDHEEARERVKPSSNNADGIFVAALTVYISGYDLNIVPRKGTNITIDGTTYKIARVGIDMGEITLDLEALDE